ncbi:toxin-antitoxin system YwqK family antitoxin [Streptomyces sp. NPDC001339]|uniref:toxin-antitoxin system YwqK family antitoxin n=1 Tax=Streptomyces sp. NPDC001339 TaxID=3364563 RepID=UPI0036A3780B
MTSVLRIDIDDPAVDIDHAQRVLYQGEPFTGEVAEYQDGHLISLDEYTDGILNGQSREWYLDGVLRSEGIVRDARPMGEFNEWHRNGVLKSRKFFDSAIASLREEDTWDEHGVPLTSWRRDAPVR